MAVAVASVYSGDDAVVDEDGVEFVEFANWAAVVVVVVVVAMVSASGAGVVAASELASVDGCDGGIA